MPLGSRLIFSWSFRGLLTAAWIGCACLLLLGSCARSLPRKARLPDVLNEASGVYVSGPDSIWWHNDSGDGPVVYLTDRYGQFRDSVRLPGAEAVDWEDITGDDRGYLYAGDFGNNLNKRTDLRILRFRPHDSLWTTIHFAYPDQNEFPPPPQRAHFDTEAFFWHADRLHLFTKSRLGTGIYQTKHYTLPDRPGRYVATLRDSFDLDKRVVTAAAIRSDGQQVALLSYFFKLWLGLFPITRTTVYLFDGYEDDHFLRGDYERVRVPKFILPTQYEALDYYAPNHLLVGSERTVLFRQKLRYIELPQGAGPRP